MAQWYYKIAEQVVGPLAADQLKALAAGGRLAPNDPVAQSPGGPWVSAARVKGLFAVAEIDDQAEPAAGQSLKERSAASPPVAKGLSGRIAEPPILKPPVVMSTLAPPRASPAAGPAPPTDSGSLAGFAIETEPVGAISHLQKRGRKQREPLTKAQKNARLVKWLSAALVLGAAVLVSIPYLRTSMRPKPESVAAPKPVFHDLDIDSWTTDLDDALRVRSGATADVRRQAKTPAAGSPSAGQPTVAAEDAVEVKPVRVSLDRPKMAGSSGKMARPVNRLLVVELELRLKGSTAPVRFYGFGGFGREITMTDQRGAAYDVRTPDSLHNMFVEGQCREPVFLSANEPARDAVIFAWPETSAPSLPSSGDGVLRLRLPKAAFGGSGQLRFEIPLAEIEVTREGERAAAPGSGANSAPLPAREKETSPANAEPVDDGGPIQIPGLR